MPELIGYRGSTVEAARQGWTTILGWADGAAATACRLALPQLLVLALLCSLFCPVLVDAAEALAPLPAAQVSLKAADAAVVFDDNGAISRQLHIPLYSWAQPQVPARAVVLAMHGLAMHGKSYEAIGRALAQRGYLVYSIDMRGYGRCISAAHEFCVLPDCKQPINYERSFDDLARTARCLRERYPGLPLFGVGESLGGAIMIRLAAAQPELIDGLILASPAIKHQNYLDRALLADAGLVIANPRKQLDLMPFARRLCSDDPRVVAEMDNDPLVRRHLSIYELMQSSQAIRKNVAFIDKVPAATPVLVIQGSADRCVKANAVMILLARLRSVDQTVKWFHQRGHILLETDYVKPDTMDTVVSWLDNHVSTPAVQAKCNHAAVDVIGRADKNPPSSLFDIYAGRRRLTHCAIIGGANADAGARADSRPDSRTDIRADD